MILVREPTRDLYSPSVSIPLPQDHLPGKNKDICAKVFFLKEQVRLDTSHTPKIWSDKIVVFYDYMKKLQINTWQRKTYKLYY